MKALPLKTIKINSPFGMRMHPIEKKMKLHNGVDLYGTTGTPVFAVDDGTVLLSKFVSGAGETIVIRHSNYFSYYCHLSKRNFIQGQSVKAGQEIGLVGNTGASTGAHLHFGLAHTFNISNFSNSNWFDPVPEMEDVTMAKTPMNVKDLRTGKKFTVQDNYYKDGVNHPAIRELLNNLGLDVDYDAKEKVVIVK